MSEWKAIETAPTDGTDVDLWAKKWSPGNNWSYQRFPKHRFVIRWGKWTAFPRQRKNGHDTISGWEPTHWMPIPEPPVTP